MVVQMAVDRVAAVVMAVAAAYDLQLKLRGSIAGSSIRTTGSSSCGNTG